MIGVCGLSGVQRLEIVVQNVNLRRILAIENGKWKMRNYTESAMNRGVVRGYRLVELDVVRIGMGSCKN